MTFWILLLAVVLRVILINQSLWLDESLEALALQGYFGPIMRYALNDFQPPLYHLIGLVVTKVAGYSELALRLPSLFSGVATVYFALKLGRHYAGQKGQVIAGLLAATNPLLIYYSQEGRTYAMTAFFITASFYYLVQNSTKKYFFFTLLAIWTSYISWIAVALQALYLLSRRQYKLFYHAIAAAMTLILWLPSLMASLGIGLTTAAESPEWGKVVGGISAKALALTWVKMVIGRVSFVNNYLYASVVLAIFALHGLVIRYAKKIDPLILLWLLGPIIGASLVSLLVPVYSYFRLLFVVPAYLLVIALGLTRAPRSLTIVLVGLQLFFVGYYWFNPVFHREDWRSLTSYINNQSEGIVGMPSLNQSAPLVYYQLNKPLIEPKISLTDTPQTIYYLRYVEDLFDREQIGHKNLTQAGYQIVSEVSYTGLKLVVYENTN